MAKRGPKEVTQAHKDAMASGRNDARAVKAYLEALRTNRPKRGRKRTTDSIQAQLTAVETQLKDASAFDELQLLQRRRDLQAELLVVDDKVDIAELEAAFVAVAASYSAKKGIDYATWREVGVEAVVLKRAGVSRAKA
jgi:hypothetical protein